MAKRFLTGIDLNKNELLNASIQNLVTNPSSPVSGQIYYNSTDKTLRYWNGTVWLTVGTGATIDAAVASAIDAITTSDIEEGTNLYFTDERAQDTAAAMLTNGVHSGISATYDDVDNRLNLSVSNQFPSKTTDNLSEGTSNLYFTNERAQDAVVTALNNGTHTNVTVTYDDNANSISLAAAPGYTDADARAAISVADGLAYNSSTGEIKVKLYGGQGLDVDVNNHLKIDRTTVDAWYDASGAASTVAGDLTTHISDTSTHGVTGDIVGTSDTQTLSNKTFSDSLKFSTGLNWSAIHANGNDLNIDGSDNLTLTTNTGDIVLNANGMSYITSASAGNEIATHSYVDTAISGLNWKESAHLFAKTINIPLTGTTGTVVIDSHAALGSTETGYRILLAGQTTTTENGIYVYTDNGSTYTLTRTEDADTIGELLGAAIFIMEGTIYGSTSWVQSNTYADTFDDLVWTQFSGTGAVTAGTGISIDGTAVSIDRTTVDGWYDANGAAATALSSANSYADGLATNYDPAGAATTAENNAKSYADGLATNYDAAGAATTAYNNAVSYADGLAVNYDAAGAATTAYNNATAYADGLASNYDAAGTAAAAVAALTLTKKYTATNVSITPSGGIATWSIPAATHLIGSFGSIIVQMKEVSGAIVDADISVHDTTGDIVITWNSATTVTAGTYRITAMG